MSAAPALEVRRIAKRFGKLLAVDHVSFQVDRGQICGFIGPNGAGKTTTMRIIATLEMPDDGDVLLNGRSVLEEPREVRQSLGFMPDSYGAYSSTTVLDYLDFFARAYGLHGNERRRTIRRVIDFTGLEPMTDKWTHSLSKGMKQRLCLAKTLLHDPSTLILDEPAAGLDPRARVELRELVKALGEMNKAVLISSHILTELAEMCNSVTVIEQGRIKASGDLDSVSGERQVEGQAPLVYVRIATLAPLEETRRFLLEQPGVQDAAEENDLLRVGFTGAAEEQARLLEGLVSAGLRPTRFAPDVRNLEDVFLSLTEGKVQ